MNTKVPNELLLSAALQMLRATGESLEKMQTKTRAMQYRLSTGKTVRVRTCNDHILVVLASGTHTEAKLNIEGTDYLLIAMPEVPRTPGPVTAYFLLSEVAVAAARASHAEWLASSPSRTAGNTTWNLWFDDLKGAAWGGYAERWANYRLPSLASMSTDTTQRAVHFGLPPTLGTVILEARAAIASAAGVMPQSVKISIDMD